MSIYYVDGASPAAADANAGTAASPWSTLAKANNTAVSGDTVMVGAATYAEQVDAKADGVTWQGRPGATVDGGNVRSFGIRLTNHLSNVVQGFTFKNCVVSGVQIIGGGDHRIRYNTCFSNGSGIKVQPLSATLFSPVDGGAGTLAAGTYSYAITGVVGGAETLASFTLAATVAANHSVTLSWDKMTTADSFNIYGRVAGNLTKITSVVNSFGAGFPTWKDDGSLSPDGTTILPKTTTVNITPCWVEGNDVYLSISHGIYLYGAINSFVRGNKSHHNQFHGIALLNNSNGNEVSFNRTYSNLKPGSRVAGGIQCDNFGTGTSGSNNNIIQFNRSFMNDDSGISIYNGSTSNIVRRNILFGNGDHGVDNFNSSGTQTTNNTSYLNQTAGFNAEGTSSNVLMKNNISVDNGINSPRTSSNYRFDQVAYLTGTMDNNLSYLSVPAANQAGGLGITNSEIVWANINYATYAAFRAAVPAQSAHGVSADPLFKDVANGDFTLAAGSPAKGLGATSAPSSYIGFDFEGNTASSTPTAGAYQ